MKMFLILMMVSLFFWQCNSTMDKKENSGTHVMEQIGLIPDAAVARITGALVEKYGKEIETRAARGVTQAAGLWRQPDGSSTDFETFCMKHFIASENERETVFKKISENYEALFGHFDRIRLQFKRAMDLPGGDVHPIDYLFGGYDPGAHVDDDFYDNKIAFITVLNFPFYSLEEKRKLGAEWSGQEWAYARLGDEYAARVPARLLQDYSAVNSNAGAYISEYNIYMGHLLNDNNEKLFPNDMVLLSHWNLRDELKANYNTERGLEKQKMVYQVMKRIIFQEIPQKVINNGLLDWNPYQNKVYEGGVEIAAEREPDARYSHLLENFKALKVIDAYYPPAMDTYIKRKFDREMEISQPEVEALFIKLVSSPQVKKMAQLIRARLKRDLEPFDIWYDGFKARSGISEEKLNEITRKKYPDAGAMEKDLPAIFLKLGFSEEKAAFLASKIQVDPARGSGHAWGARMKAAESLLRTRVPRDGMNYKGYNIAVHELGHNVEQTISLHDVDYYMMEGVPNTAFTEALAFVFQERDLELLGIKETNPDKKHMLALDTFWSVYEIMGVSLVDMNVWKWMYGHPQATPRQLKEAVINIAVDIWNKYYADVFGIKDQPILAIYSHMISYPLYLSAYSYGHLIHFQLERYLAGKDFAAEVQRMFSAGRLIPQLWMKRAVGSEIAVEPLLQAVEDALQQVKP